MTSPGGIYVPGLVDPYLDGGASRRRGGSSSASIWDLIVFWGQSNCLGHDNVPAIDSYWTTSHPCSVWWWEEGAASYYSGAGTADASGSTDNDFVVLNTHTTNRARASADISLARHLTGMGRRVAVVRCGQGSTNLASDWNFSSPGAKDLFAVSSDEVTAALADSTLPFPGRYRLWFWWWQGEQDAAVQVNAEAYATNLDDLWNNGVKSQAWATNAVDAQMLMMQLHVGNLRTYTSTVRSEQATFAAANTADVTLVDIDHYCLNDDGDHYDPEVYCEISVDMARTEIEADQCGTVYTAGTFSDANYFQTAAAGDSNLFPGGATTMFVWAAIVWKNTDSVTNEITLMSRFLSGGDGWKFMVRDDTPARITLQVVDGTAVTRTMNYTLSTHAANQVQIVGARFSSSELQPWVDGAFVGGTNACTGITAAITNRTGRIGIVSSGSADQFEILACGYAERVPSTAEGLVLVTNVKKGLYYLPDSNGDPSMGSAGSLWVASGSSSNWTAQWGTHDGSNWDRAMVTEQGTVGLNAYAFGDLTFP